MQPKASPYLRVSRFLRSCFAWDRPFLRNLLIISLPMMLQELLGASLHIIDGMMVSGLGDAAYSGVIQANRYTFAFNLFLFGATSGGAIFISQYWGARDISRMRQAMGIALGGALLVALVFMTGALLFPRQIISVFLQPGESFELSVAYLRIIAPGYVILATNAIYATALKAAEKTYIPMLAGVAGVLTNTAFNYMLIYGKLGFPALGVEGAAIATVLSSGVTLVINLGFAYGKRLPAGARPKELLCRDKAFLGKFLKTVAPVVANEGLWGLGTTMFSVFYGVMGDVSIAAIGVSNTINDLVWVCVFGVTNAAAILVGKTLGEGQKERAYLYAKRLLATGLAGGLVLGLILLTLRIPMVGLFTGLSQATRDKAQILIFIAGLGLCLRSFNCVNIVGVLRSGGDTLYSMLLDAGTMWLLSVPLVGLATLVFHWPIEIVFCLTYTDELVKLIIGIPRFASRKWIHVLTSAKEEEALGNA